MRDHQEMLLPLVLSDHDKPFNQQTVDSMLSPSPSIARWQYHSSLQTRKRMTIGHTIISWRDARNREHPENPCPEDLLYKQPFDVSALSYWLSRYACETHTRVGKKYPASTVSLPSWWFTASYAGCVPRLPQLFRYK